MSATDDSADVVAFRVDELPPRLRTLRIRDSAAVGGLESFTFVPSVSSSSSPDLVELQLWGNRIARLNDRSFAPLGQLRRLDLDRNRIAEIRPEVWTGSPPIVSLRLADNRLTAIADGAFAALSASLRALVLDRNSLAFLQSGSLRGLSDLVVLSLSDNRIALVGDGAFADLRQLRRLDLSGNRLERIWAGTFNGLAALESIDLSRNRLDRVPDGALRHATSLAALLLDGNRLGDGLGRCALYPGVVQSTLRSVSLLGTEQVRCRCRTRWLVEVRSARYHIPGVWGHCLSNSTDGTTTVAQSLGRQQTYDSLGCSDDNWDSEC